jgi:hypothetical protein
MDCKRKEELVQSYREAGWHFWALIEQMADATQTRDLEYPFENSRDALRICDLISWELDQHLFDHEC